MSARAPALENVLAAETEVEIAAVAADVLVVEGAVVADGVDAAVVAADATVAVMEDMVAAVVADTKFCQPQNVGTPVFQRAAILGSRLFFFQFCPVPLPCRRACLVRALQEFHQCRSRGFLPFDVVIHQQIFTQPGVIRSLLRTHLLF